MADYTKKQRTLQEIQDSVKYQVERRLPFWNVIVTFDLREAAKLYGKEAANAMIRDNRLGALGYSET